MQLQGVSVIFLLGAVMGLAGGANGLCLVRNTTILDQYWYQCSRSTDYFADLKKAPVDIHGHTVSNAKIKIIRNQSYARFNKSLVSLAVVFCGVEEIEDNAFHGATSITLLILMGNKLEVIKSAWLKGLPNLREASFKQNRIKTVEENLFSIQPSLNVLDIQNNRLTCLPTTSFGNINLTELYFRQNRLTWKCRILLTDWLKANNIRGDGPYARSMDPPYDLAKICVTRLPTSRLDEELLDKCVEDTTHELLPPKGDYTVEQVCEFLKDKPSPFLDCNK